MFSHSVAVVQDIVEVGRNTVVEKGSENVIDKMLERSRGVGKSQRYDKGFQKTVADAEGRFPHFTFGHAEQVVGVLNVESGIVLCLGNVVQGLL